MNEWEEKIQQAIWSARSLFERGKVSGSAANLSFLHAGKIYITASGTCFGRLTPEDFAVVSLADGTVEGSRKPSKELPLHRMYYLRKPGVTAVIHTHGFYSVMWSMLSHPDPADVIPDHTPYLKMKLGRVGLVPYAPPGSAELFAAFEQYLDGSDGFLLAHHGAVVGGKSVLDAFYALEELDEAARVAWAVRQSGEPIPEIDALTGSGK